MSEPSSRKRHRARIPFFLLIFAAAGVLVYPFAFPIPPWAGLPPWLFLLPAIAAFCLALVSAWARSLAGRPHPWFLPFHLAFFFSAGWAVKSLIGLWGLIPLVFFLAYPFSLVLRDRDARKTIRLKVAAAFRKFLPWRGRTGGQVPRVGAGKAPGDPSDDTQEISFADFWKKPDIFWFPLLALLLPSLSRLAFASRPDLLLWTGIFFPFGLVFSLGYGWKRYEDRYNKAKEVQYKLWEDAKRLDEHVRRGQKLEEVTVEVGKRRAILPALVKDQDDLYNHIVGLGLRTFGARTGIFFLYEDPDGFRMRASPATKELQQILCPALLKPDHTLVREALKEKKDLLYGDPPPPEPGLFPFYRCVVPVGSILFQLLRRDQRPDGTSPFLGAVYFDSGEKGHFGTDNLDQLAHIADYLCKVGRVFEGMHWKANALDHTDLLAGFARSLTQTLDPRQIALSALQALYQMAELMGAAVILLEKEGMRVEAAEGVFLPLQETLIPFGEPSLLHQAVTVGSPMEWRRRSAGHDPCFLRRGEQMRGFSAFYAHPSRMKDRMMAVLAVALGGPAAEDPMRFAMVKDSVKQVADLAAPALENAYSHKEIEALSRTDGLTGLENHRVFQEALQSKISRVGARGYGGPFALLLLDVDFFKQVNDNYGHPVGDEVLREVARRIRTSVRELDLVARYGGEEFAAILDEVKTVGDALRIAEKVRSSVAASPVPTTAGPLRKTLSAGYALYNPREGITPQELLDRADQALYHAKEAGRNRTVGFHEISGRPGSQAGSRNLATQ